MGSRHFVTGMTGASASAAAAFAVGGRHRRRRPARALVAAAALLTRVSTALLLPGPPWVQEGSDTGYCAGPAYGMAPGSSVASAFVLESPLNDPAQYPKGGEVAFATVAVRLNGALVSDFNLSICADMPPDQYEPCGVTESFAWFLEAGPVKSGYTTFTASFPFPWFKFQYTPARGNRDVRWLVLKYAPAAATVTPDVCIGDALMRCTAGCTAMEYDNNEKFFFRLSDSQQVWTQSTDPNNHGVMFALFQPSPTPSASATATATRTSSATATSTRTSTATKSATASASATATASTSSSASATGSASASASASATATMTSTSTATTNATVADGAAAAAPPPVALIAGASAALLLLVLGGALFSYCVLLPHYRAGTGPWQGRMRQGPKQYKDRSIARRLEVRRDSLRGIAPPKGHYASKLPEALRADALASMASAYDEVYGAGVSSDPAAAAASAAAAAAAASAAAAANEGLGRPAPLAAAAAAPAASPAPAPASPAGSGTAAEWGSRRGLSKSRFGPTQLGGDARSTVNPAALGVSAWSAVAEAGGGGAGEGAGAAGADVK
jgi:hypothetical protein